MDLLADEMHGLGIRRDGRTHAIRWRRFFKSGWSVAAVILISTSALERAALASVAIPATARAASTLAVVASRRAVIAAGKVLGFLLLLVAGGTRPSWAKREAGQKAAQRIGFGITHEAKSKECFSK
jgi:hypothetical protein